LAVKSNELIDDVARRMTVADPRPALRARVMAGIGEASQDTSRRWLMPVAGSAALATLALAWFLVPSRPMIEAPPVVTQRAPVVVAEPEVARPAEVQVARATSVRAPRAVVAAPVPLVWDTAPMAEVPGLPPLEGPPPIVIEPITWDVVTITPLNVELIEVKALVVEPLAPVDRGGV
jgi:hypothetical protein